MINKMTSYNYEKYEENLNKISPKPEPYFQIDILFSKKDYEEVYIAIMEGIDKLTEKLKKLINYNSNNDIELV